jgi:alginate O-acetyltransferase complex protein AlgI
MLFLTYWFVLFAAVLFPAYWLAQHPVARRLILLIGSAAFHTHFAGPAGVLPIIALGTATYLAGRTRHHLACRTMAVFNVVALVYYKYALFLSQQVICAIWPGATEFCTTNPYLQNIVPPLAISFFVFEYVHYLLDVAGGSEPIRGVTDFALFSIFWPSIVAGPVKRYQHFLGELSQGLRHMGASDVAEGLVRVAMGYVKKVAADNLTAYIMHITPRYDTLSVPWRWFVVLCIGARILLDFSGYSDLAIGFARMHGIGLPENFRWPYLSRNLSEFWRRWHMSLSSWIRDYVYIALGGNRRGLLRTVFNGLFTFALCGLWHGAGFNFLAWGVLHGAGLAIAGNYRRLWLPGRVLGRVFDLLPPLGWGVTMLFVFLGWLFFFYPVPQAVHMMHLLLPAQWRFLPEGW